jgi:hypothetical protein
MKETREPMRALFQDILRTDDLKGVVVLSEEGAVLFHELLQDPGTDLKNLGRLVRVPELRKAREMELLYEHDRLYLRRLGGGVIIVWTGVFASAAMVKLSCDVLIPSLEKTLAAKGWRLFFKKS